MEKCIARDFNHPSLRPPFCQFSPPFFPENYWNKVPGKLPPYTSQPVCYPILKPMDQKAQSISASKKKCTNDYVMNSDPITQPARPKDIILPAHFDGRDNMILNKDVLIPSPLHFPYPNSPPTVTPQFVPNWFAIGRLMLNYKLLQQQLLNFPSPLAGVPPQQISSPDPFQYSSLYYKQLKDVMDNSVHDLRPKYPNVKNSKIFKPTDESNCKIRKDSDPRQMFQPQRSDLIAEAMSTPETSSWTHSKPIFTFDTKSEMRPPKKVSSKYMTSLKHGITSVKDKKSHKCVYCGKLYSRKYGLKIHIRTHTGYKPLKCKVCGRPFGDPSNLNKHVRLHAQGDTPYRCEYCGKVLVRRRDLERHIKSRHPEHCPEFVLCPPADPRLWSKS